MKHLTDIRQLYTPVQPSVNRVADNVRYTEFLPDIRLQKFIYNYWEFKTLRKLNNKFEYKVVPNGCIDIFFEINNARESFVTGLTNRHSSVSLHTSFHYVGICFMPTVFPQIYNIKASELSNRFEDLAQVIPKTASFIGNNFTPFLNISQIKLLLDQYFLRIISQANFKANSRLYEALHFIVKNHGTVNVESDLDLGISSRQLRRLFELYIGEPPKSFSKIVRFQNVLKVIPSIQNLRQEKFFFDFGLYDQAHFIKDFKNFYGLTPGKALGR